MSIPITRYGQPQVTVFTLLGLVLATASGVFLPTPWCWIGVAVFGLFTVWVLSFFRDPNRVVPTGDKLLVSPADGKVTDITEVDDPEYVGEKCIMIGIFLSVFNVHINRAPAAGKVDYIKYVPGKFLNAMSSESGRQNEANLVGMKLDDGGDRVLVKQIAGLIARTIVCRCNEGDALARGERFGMIKFGSRTELYVPVRRIDEVTVTVGQSIKAGRDIVGKLT